MAATTTAPDPTLQGGHALEPVMSLYARVCQAKTLEPGARVGYGGSHVVERATRVLTLAIGYADGLPRAAGNRFAVGLGGRRVPLVGRVSCDLATVDGGPEAPEGVGAAALVFGRADGQSIDVTELAAATGTISYEILVRIGERVPRLSSPEI